MKQIEYKDNSYVLEIIGKCCPPLLPSALTPADTAGTEQFVSMRNLYMKAGEVFVVVFSIVAESTFFETKEIRQQILDTKEPAVPPIVLVGNKLDLADERTVKKEQGEAQAKAWSSPYIECSAKANENIEAIFSKCVQLHLGVRRVLMGGVVTVYCSGSLEMHWWLQSSSLNDRINRIRRRGEDVACCDLACFFLFFGHKLES